MSEMRNDPGHERWQDDLAAYVLGALNADEAHEFERHIESCDHCQAGLRWLMPAINALPESVEQHEPSSSLRTKVIGEVRRDAAEQSHSWRRRLGAALRGSGRGPVALRPAMGMLAVLLVAVVAGYAISSSGSEEGGGGSTVVSGKAPGIVAKVVREESGGEGTLHLSNVEPLHDDHVLEAWIQRDGEVTPVRSLFAPDNEGNATTALPNMKGVEAVMVTIEPAGGSDLPTSDPIATVAMPKS